MRITIKHGVIAAVTLSVFLGLAAQPARAAVSFDLFYSNLSPHGSWMVSTEYGRVWQPAVYARDWNPYYDGHWEYTDVGWAWVSDYSWGAIPYHYGTWVLDPRIGWVWVPGYTWAPAWVTFRTGPDYIGWAPVAPNFSLDVSFGGRGPSLDAFLFVSTRDFSAPRVRSYVIPERRARTIFNHTTVINNLTIQNNIVVNRGPDLRLVERASRRKIPVTRVERVPRVAPFQGVRREQLAIAADRSRRSIRAAEPVPESRSLPRAEDRASRTGRPIDRRIERQPSPDTRRAQPGREPRVQPRESVRGKDRPPPAPRMDTLPARIPDRRDPRVIPTERVTPRPQGAPDRTTKSAERPAKQNARKQKTEEPKKHDGH